MSLLGFRSLPQDYPFQTGYTETLGTRPLTKTKIRTPLINTDHKRLKMVQFCFTMQ